MNESTHPAGARIDAVATGDADAEAIAHVASCEACAAYVAALRAQIEAFADQQKKTPDGFVEEVARAGAARRRNRIGPRLAMATTALALAAGLVLLVRGQPAQPIGGAPSATAEGPLRFKGESQVSVVIERNGAQSRVTSGTVGLAPGDRIRAEMALEHDEEVAAGVLTRSGEWATLQPPTFLAAGTHFSERDIAFDDRIEEGWVVVGPPPAVERARLSRDFSGVRTLRIEPIAQ